MKAGAYFGKGLYKNYVDLAHHVRMGYFESTMNDMFVPYIKPQENGNRKDVKCISVTDIFGNGLAIKSYSGFETQISRYSYKELTEKKHPCD